MIKIINYRDKVPENHILINTTSRSENWSKDLSPFLIGENMKLYGNAKAMNMENAWQYCKLYPAMADKNGYPTAAYYKWATVGWASKKAVRYPMGQGAIPLCSIWNGKRMDYIEAREKIYIPLYAREVVKTSAFRMLQSIYKVEKNIVLLDFDGYDHIALGLSYEDVIKNPEKKMGHAFVLAMLLDDYL